MDALLRKAPWRLTVAGAVAIFAAFVSLALLLEVPELTFGFLFAVALCGSRFGVVGGAAATVLATALVLLIGMELGSEGDVEDAIANSAVIAAGGVLVTVLSVSLKRTKGELFHVEEQARRSASDLSRLGTELLEAESRERERIAQSLHDGVLQTLLVVNQDLLEHPPGSVDARRVQEAVSGAIDELRDVASEVHPAAVAYGGLEAALWAVTSTAQRIGGFELNIDAEYQAAGYHDDLLVALTRELVMNAAKHSRAKRVDVIVSERPTDIVVSVIDDGKGLPLASTTAMLVDGGLGLASVSTRVRAAGGSFELRSQGSGSGTAVEVVLPKRTAVSPARDARA